MKLLKILPFVAVCLTAPAYAQSLFDKLDADDLSPTKVSIADDATGGCWTNAGEAKSYAEDQLRLAGVEVVQDDISPINTVFRVIVSADRDTAGWCIGSIEAKFMASVEFQNKEILAGLLDSNSYFQNRNNANSAVLDLIKDTLTGGQFERR
jgi:hypothetical protein